MQKLGFIVSVGTSLLKHYESWLKNKNINKTALEGFFKGEVEENYLDSIVNSIEDEKDTIYPSAEIQTLGLFFKDNSDYLMCHKMITLVPVKGQESEACAALVKQILSNANTSSCILGSPAKVDIKGFEVTFDDDRRFSNEAADLVAAIRSFSDDYRSKKIGCERVVICISAGYKVLIPYLSLLGFIDGHEVIYAHRSSKSVITIPQLPFNWDLRSLDEYRILLMTDDVPSSVYHTLPQRIKSFYHPKSHKREQERFYGKSAYGKMISQDYTEERRSRVGWGETLLSYFYSEELKIKLRELINGEWEYLWLGDQIPETVEHTRSHSSRLMELTRELFQLTSISLDDEELFCLIAAFFLHDLGHTALISKEIHQNGTYFPLHLFPSLVRDLHHLLSGELISDLESLEPYCQKTVATISNYHRRKMPLKSDQKSFRHWLFEKEKLPMEVEMKDSEIDIGLERLMLLTAILRFLDGCDVQADRVINEEYRESRQKRTDREIYIYTNRLNSLLGNLSNKKDNNTKHVIDMSERLKKALDNWGEGEGEPNNRKELRLDIQKLAYHFYQNGCHFGYLEILSLIDNILFKREQEEHFLKHSGVECVYLGSPRGDGCSKSNAPSLGVYILVKNTDKEEHYNMIESVKEVAKDIWSEYEAVKSVLEDYFNVTGIYLNTGDNIKKIYP